MVIRAAQGHATAGHGLHAAVPGAELVANVEPPVQRLLLI